MAEEKTEKPTEQRKRQARRDGTIARTPDLGVWVGMLAASVLLPMVARSTLERAQALYVRGMGIVTDPDPTKAIHFLRAAMIDGAVAVAPLAVALFVIALAAAATQGGLRPATKLFMPDFKRLNPISGLKKVLGPQGLWEGLKALLKGIVIGLVVYYALRNLIPALLSSTAMPLQALVATIGGAVISIIQAAAAAGLVLAAADYGMAKRRTNKQLRMSKQEIKEEHKRSEGDPHVKGQIRARQMEMARQRMMSDLKKADVVLVNPTHVAVALRYEPTKGAPRVVAKGAGLIADKIREVAREHRIPMVQDVALARALYRSCDLGDEIPAEFFGAVARVLAFVMLLKSKGSAAGLHTNLDTTFPNPSSR
jgi:flagellar biosynthetic protein FlhB